MRFSFEVLTDDVAPLKVDTTSRPSNPPGGPMTRARVKALQVKMNYILSTINLDTPLYGLLLHSETLCVIRYEHQEEYAKGDPTPDKEGEGEQLRLGTCRHCRRTHLGTAIERTPALPPESPEAPNST
jgi:hypothetical protein